MPGILGLLDEDDFPLAQVGNLIMSPARKEPVLVADCIPVARQIVQALNFQAATERTLATPENWLKVH